MRVEGSALELGVELDSDEPGVIGALHDLRQGAVGAHSGEDQAALLERILVVDIDLVAVAVALRDAFGAVDGSGDAVAGEDGRIGAQPHRATQIPLRGPSL